ncbi:DUF3244 domain-containing protein [Bacteroides sp. GM023]|uniref:DUF3244 domain-containing protein n=1 Tax=Bacteroides sp. GM023 TaxID=2723058 RepID=UPI00168AFA53|nr:DUF3244 domain-containing protein [Bacteroides sp. GM023]MBD3590792.1 DUF3244 domain-containing protein [Bacteroides sp. GM023]
MKRLSIVLLLIGISFMTMEANTLSEHRTKRLVIKIWHQHREVPVSIPIEAILDENSIEVRFLEHVDKQVIFQVKDQQGNIMFQDVIVTPNEAEVYKIDLEGFKVGHYELLYIEEDTTFIGKFSIEQ